MNDCGSALFESASIIPDQTPFSSGERSGNLSGNAQKTTQSRDKKKAEPLVFQRDSAMCEKFSKKVSDSRRISREPKNKSISSYANACPAGHVRRILIGNPRHHHSHH